MAVPQQVSLPPFYSLSSGWVIKWVALDATTGAQVTDVVISNRTIGIDKADEVAPVEDTQPPGQVYLIPGPAMPV